MNLSFLPLFITLAGFILGLGAVTVIDIHGFLGRKSAYWTLATTRTHKVTKPLIWVGIALVVIGTSMLYFKQGAFFWIQLFVSVLMILNGLFLSFVVSPYLLKQEARGEAEKLLPQSFQKHIVISMLFSFVCWWGSLALLVLFLTR